MNGNGQKEITFGELFSIYVVVSNKLVGVLLRARKHGLVAFEGETLFQGQDEKTKVTMLKTLEEVRRIHDRRDDDDQEGDNDKGEFQWGKCMKTS